MSRYGLLLIFFIFVFSGIASAQTFDNYNFDFYLADGNVIVHNEILLDESYTGSLNFFLPEDADKIIVYIDGVKSSYSLKSEILKASLENNTRVKLVYSTKKMTDGSTFRIGLQMPSAVENFRMILHLPRDVVINRPVRKGLNEGSVVPHPTRMETDGRAINVIWERNNLEEGEDFSVFVDFKGRCDIPLIIYILFGFALLTVVLLFLIKGKVRKVVEKEYEFERHLKEDEDQIVSILKQRDGKCQQGTLKVITGFSKSKLSDLLKEMEERRIVYKEKRGKKNLIFLR